MGIHWSTFILEIINFLVLVWLLKRFFYHPIKSIVERRRHEIEGKLAEAERRLQEVEVMKQRYEGRLADWEAEKKKCREKLNQELEQERKLRIQALQQELEAGRRKAEAVWEQEKREWRRHMEEQALQLGADFVARLLQRLADEHLHHRMVALLLEDLGKLPEAELENLRRNAQSGQIHAVSAYPLRDDEQIRLMQVLGNVLGRPLEIPFEVDAGLLSGVRIDLGAYVIRASLCDELKFFAHGREGGGRKT